MQQQFYDYVFEKLQSDANNGRKINIQEVFDEAIDVFFDCEDNKKTPKECPWCHQTPTYKKQKCEQNYDSNGNYYHDVIELPQEIIECENTKCYVRPKLIRVNTKDVIDVWNKRS